MSTKPWGGRFSAEPDPELAQFARSYPLDLRLLPQDLAGSAAHARMLAAQGILSPADAQSILEGLGTLAREVAEGRSPIDPQSPDEEDVHMAVERVLTARIGEPAKRLHTGRSRNDQVAVDLRLYLRTVAHTIMTDLTDLLARLVDRASEALSQEIVLPGYTHLQRAQPVLLAHVLLAHAEALDRDRGRLSDLAVRANRSPLGSAALAGSTLPLDPFLTSALLGFDGPFANSVDAVADRDFLAEFLAFAALAGVHMSRIAEEMILWTTTEFGFAELADSAAFGSSLMPQKKNPEAFEHVRGRSGRLVGILTGFLTTLKGLPLAYDSDLQESHTALYSAADTLHGMLRALDTLMGAVTFSAERMARAAEDPLLLATDLADALVARGVPFRTAHHQVGALVGEAARSGTGLRTLPSEVIRELAPSLPPNLVGAINAHTSAGSRTTPGGTAPDAAASALSALRMRVANPPPLPPPAPTVDDVLGRTLEPAAAPAAPAGSSAGSRPIPLPS